MDDLLAADILLSVLDFIEASPALSQVATTRRRRKGGGGGGSFSPSTILLGHSRGAKVSVLAAAREAAPSPRIAALALLDPVNVTRYAPQSPRFPSATAALVAGPAGLAALPVCIVGGGWAHDCAPEGANYDTYYAACRGPTWMTVLPGAGHFQFVGGGGGGGAGGDGAASPSSSASSSSDSATFLQRALCAEGPATGEAVRAASAGAVTAWSLAVLGGGVGVKALQEEEEAAPPPPPLPAKGGKRRPPAPPQAAAAFPTAAWLDAAEADMRTVLGGEAGVVAVRKGVV